MKSVVAAAVGGVGSDMMFEVRVGGVGGVCYYHDRRKGIDWRQWGLLMLKWMAGFLRVVASHIPEVESLS